MSKVRVIQNKILELSGGEFQRLFDEYIFKKYDFKNINTLGIQTGTNKTTKGTPDTYIVTPNGKYILITCGSVSDNSFQKIKSDIVSCLDREKLDIEKSNIEKIICGHISTNIRIEQLESLQSELSGIEVELIGIDTISHDLTYNYPNIAKKFLNVTVDTHQLFDIYDFVANHDKSGISPPVNCNFCLRETELNEIISSIENQQITIVSGASGVGKTRIVLEICQKYINEGWEVRCIKSNGLSLYDDLRDYLDKKGNYLLFFDDANQITGLEGVLDYLFTLPDGYIVKIIFTVRDYAKKRILDTVSEYKKPGFITIKVFKDEEIKDILKINYKIENPRILDRIVNISCGNIRIAILAATKILTNDFETLKTTEDLFKVYYERIFKDTSLTKEDLLFLCVIFIVRPVRLHNNEFYQKLLNSYLPEIEEELLISKLYDLELVDWFKDEIVNVSDQNLGDYILYYIFYEKKWLKLCDVIDDSFPNFRHKMIYVLNTLTEKFYSTSMISFINREIKDAWDNTCENNERHYLESFYNVYPEKSLLILKNFVDNAERTKVEISEEIFKKNKNNNVIHTMEVKMLSGYKHTDYCNEATELLLNYYEKRPDLFLDFYFAIINNLLYDNTSYYYKYQKEDVLLSELWARCDEGKNYYFSLLFIHVAEQSLKTEVSHVEEVRNNNGVSICRMTIVLTDEMKQLRSNLWNRLFVLREQDFYKDMVDGVLKEIHIDGLNKDSTKEFLMFDFDSIFPHFKNDIDYVAARIIERYRKEFEYQKIPLDNRLLKAEESEYFRVFKHFSNEYYFEKQIEEYEEAQKTAIVDEIKKYSVNDFDKLFEACEYICNTDVDDIWKLESGIAIVFDFLGGEPDKYKMVLEKYFIHGAPAFCLAIHKVVKFLLSHYGYSSTHDIICEHEFRQQKSWLFSVWECISENDVAEENAIDFKEFIENNTDVIPSYDMLIKYCKYDNTLLENTYKRLMENNYQCQRFMMKIAIDKSLPVVIDLFVDKIGKLCEIFIKSLDGGMVDNDGKIFWVLYDKNPGIWNEYIDRFEAVDQYKFYEGDRIDEMWDRSEYSEKICYAFNVLINEMKNYSDEAVFKIFGKDGNRRNEEKKKGWLLEQLYNSKSDLNRCKRLIYVVATAFSDWEVEYVMKFLSFNKNIEDFKNMYLFPLMRSWSGSEIPIINEELDFLYKLKNQISGTDYIGHKSFIEKIIREREKYKEQVEIREYIEAALYA